MTKDEELLQGWYEARADARVQLEAFESGIEANRPQPFKRGPYKKRVAA